MTDDDVTMRDPSYAIPTEQLVAATTPSEQEREQYYAQLRARSQQFKDRLKDIAKKRRGHNGECLRCGAPAYIGLRIVECSAGKRCGAPEPEPEVAAVVVGCPEIGGMERAFCVRAGPAHLIGATPEAAIAAYKRWRTRVYGL